jgi:hypothetical protein
LNQIIKQRAGAIPITAVGLDVGISERQDQRQRQRLGLRQALIPRQTLQTRQRTVPAPYFPTPTPIPPPPTTWIPWKFKGGDIIGRPRKKRGKGYRYWERIHPIIDIGEIL